MDDMQQSCVSPSTIYFTDCTASTAQATNQQLFDEISRNVSEKGTYPKLQVVEKDGHFFTLNNTQLHVYRRLEETGVCGRVRVVIVPTNDVPEGIRNMMVVPKPYTDYTQQGAADTSRKTRQGYEEIAQGESSDGDDSSDESVTSGESYQQCASSDTQDLSDRQEGDNIKSSSSDDEDHSFL